MSNMIKLKPKFEISALIDREEYFVNEAIKYGHLDPRLHPDHSKMLFVKDGDKTFRRFITGFLSLTQDNVSNTQVRKVVSNEKYCREELAPQISSKGIIQYPPMVCHVTGDQYRIETGHHRFFTNQYILGNTHTPAFELSQSLFEMHEDGTYGEPVSDVFAVELSRIQNNPAPSTNPYGYKDIPLQLSNLRKQDITFNGLMPDGDFPNRDQFDAIMDLVHPRQFLHSGTRTKIYNLWAKSGSNVNSKVKSVTFADITNDLAKNKLDTGIEMGRNGKPKRKKFLEHFDETTNTYIAVTTTNGKTFDRDFMLPLIEKQHDHILVGDESYNIVIHCQIYKPKETLTALQTDRQNFVNRVKKINKILKKTVGLKFAFSKIIFPKQLTIASDTGKVVTV